MADSYELSEVLPVAAPRNSLAPRYPHQYQDVDLVRDRYQIQPIGKRAFALQGDDGDRVHMDYQVRLAITRAKAEDDQAKTLLLRLLERCERHPTKLAVQILESRTSLLELYKALELEDKFQRALLDIEKSFNVVFDSDTERTELVLQRAIEMINWMIKSDLYQKAHPLLLRIQSEAAKIFGESSAELISVLIRIGTMLQDQDRWENARPRFEQALAAAISGNASFESPLVKNLEDALYEKKFTTGVETPEDIRRQASMSTKFPGSINRVLRRQGCELNGCEEEGIVEIALLSTLL
jgi:tetratricopeptide (TPR) repeat protein